MLLLLLLLLLLSFHIIVERYPGTNFSSPGLGFVISMYMLC